MHLIKVDSNGNLIWNQGYGWLFNLDSVFSESMVKSSDGGFAIVGRWFNSSEFTADILVVKTNSDGISEWHKIYGAEVLGSEDTVAFSIDKTSEGNFVIFGTEAIPNTKALLIKIDSLGTVLWKKTYRLGDGSWGESVKQASDGGYILGGHSRIGFDKSSIWKVDPFGQI
ncbi:MAG: hypothetical protein ABIF88_02225 [archaeon]